MAYLFIDPTKPFCRHKTLEATHWVSPLLDASMVLLQMIIQVAVRAMGDCLAQLRLDGSRIGIVPIGGDPVRHHLGDGPGGPEERLCRGTVPRLTQIDVHQIPVSIYCAVQIGPATFHFRIGFVRVPTSSHSSAPMLTETLA